MSDLRPSLQSMAFNIPSYSYGFMLRKDSTIEFYKDMLGLPQLYESVGSSPELWASVSRPFAGEGAAGCADGDYQDSGPFS